jgi:sporulation protein YlmC with PRC-barrel domain
MSLQIGGEIGRTLAPVIDPVNLKIVAYSVGGPLIGGGDPDILRTEDVREFGPKGMIIDSAEELVERDDVIKVKEIMGLNFRLVGLKVETKKGVKLGKVENYTVDPDSFMIMQLIVRRPVMKALLDPELTISREEIVEVNDYKIIVKDEEATVKKEVRAKDFVPSFVNPFREPSFAPIRKGNPGEPDIE